MSEPFLGEIRIVSFGFSPRGWALCNGQLLPINQNQALFALLGTQYGGNGQTNFALPNLQGRVPVHVGSGVVQGQAAGTESVTLTTAEMPVHGHAQASSLQATSINASGNVPAGQPRRGVARYTTAGAPVVLAGSATVGEQRPHTNMQPSLTLNFVIALQGIFPSRN
jgi:microcystin-dependent protein